MGATVPEIAVVGGGASGIAAAVAAAEAGARVVLLEGGKRIGRPILASGNGRCNWTNARVAPESYANAAFVRRAFAACPPQRVWDWFARLGLVWAEEADGRRYPQANKASSVLDVLRFRLDELGVEVRVESPVARVRPAARGGWRVELADGGSGRFDAVIAACGGAIRPGLLPEACRLAPRRPRLCPLDTDRAAVRGLDGVRAKGAVTLRRAGRAVARERGEVQFRPFGVSGIVVFDLSRFAEPGDALEIDFLPDAGEAELAAELGARMRRFPGRAAEDLLAGMVLPALARAVLRQAGIDPARPPKPGQARPLARRLKAYGLKVAGFEEAQAQVTQGGVRVNQVDPATLELAGAPGLHVTGEALDVDGPCGGYNLHWAWTCGILAGEAAARAGKGRA